MRIVLAILDGNFRAQSRSVLGDITWGNYLPARWSTSSSYDILLGTKNTSELFPQGFLGIHTSRLRTLVKPRQSRGDISISPGALAQDRTKIGGPLRRPLKRAIPFIIGLLAIVLIAAAACGGDDDDAPAERPRGTTAPVATSAPATAAPATTAPTEAAAPPTSAPVATVAAATAAPAPSGGDAAAGAAVFAAKGCVACHTIQGLAGAVGQIGPELTNLATDGASRVAGQSADAYIREAIENPPSFVVDGFAPIMPATIRASMNDTEFEDLVAYLLTLN